MCLGLVSLLTNRVWIAHILTCYRKSLFLCLSRLLGLWRQGEGCRVAANRKSKYSVYFVYEPPPRPPLPRGSFCILAFAVVRLLGASMDSRAIWGKHGGATLLLLLLARY